MRTTYQQYRLKNTPKILIAFLTLFFVGCIGYQPVSYYHDGIYGEATMQQVPQQAVNTAPAPQQSGTYYKNYFAEKATQGIQDDTYFTSAEQYQNPAPEQTNEGSYQAHGSWGDQADRTNINVVYNRSFDWNMGWGWYDAPFTFGRRSFWGYNYHPWYFTYGFNHHPYYNPYRFGWGYRGNYWSRWDYQDPYWDRRYFNGNVYRNAPTYTRLNGSRTIRGNNISRNSGRSVNSSAVNTTNRTNARSTRSTTSAQGSATTTTQRSQATSSYNQTPSRTTTRRSNSSTNRDTTSQPRNNSSRVYSNNSSSYRSSSSTSNNSYRSATPSRTTNSTRSSSPSRSTNSTRRR